MIKRFGVASLIPALVVMAVGCTIQKQDAPGLVGPSEFATSVVVTATPDLVARNGTDRTAITVRAFDHSGSPISGLPFRLDILSPAGDFGTLDSHNVVTGSDGRATVNYLPPSVPMGTTNADASVVIGASPVGTNQVAARVESVSIRLVAPQVIHVPGTPFARFSYTPEAPKAGDRVFFSAANSSADNGATIVSYTWNWGDGESAVGISEEHDWPVAGTYPVTLTVRDSLGRSGSSTQYVVVAP